MVSRAAGLAPRPPYRVVYFGTPAFAVPALERLAGLPEFDVRLVVTQPDRPSGRGRRLTASAVKVAADRLGIATHQPESLRTPVLRAPIADVAADLFVVAAYGVIFGAKTLALPRIACVNIHASLLPAYRGASPISASILAGDGLAGVSLMVMDTGLDTGPVLAQASLPLDPAETTGSLTPRLAELGAELTATRLSVFAEGSLEPVPQAVDGASLTRPLVKADGWLDWRRSAMELERQIRAMWPWPRAWTTHDGGLLQIHRGTTTPDEVLTTPRASPGTLVRLGADVATVCGDGLLVLDMVQPAGGNAGPGTSLLRAAGTQGAVILGSLGAPALPAEPPIVPIGR